MATDTNGAAEQILENQDSVLANQARIISYAGRVEEMLKNQKAILNNQIQGESMIVEIKESAGQSLPAGG